MKNMAITVALFMAVLGLDDVLAGTEWQIEFTWEQLTWGDDYTPFESHEITYVSYVRYKTPHGLTQVDKRDTGTGRSYDWDVPHLPICVEHWYVATRDDTGDDITSTGSVSCMDEDGNMRSESAKY